MYAACFICRHSFRRNDSLHYCAIGRRVAFEPALGRLWVVCEHCGQWCLTPLEERWEALEECERLFQVSPARVSKENIGVATIAGGVTLVCIGSPLRNELANWRYGPRFTKRRRRILRTNNVISAGLTAAFSAAAVAMGNRLIAVYLAIVGASYGFIMRDLEVPWTVVARLRRERRAATLRRWDLNRVFIEMVSGKQPLNVLVDLGGKQLRFPGAAAIPVLATILPHVNWKADESGIAAATAAVDDAEESDARKKGEHYERAIWERLLPPLKIGEPRRLLDFAPFTRLALEMAVAEEIERRLMSDEAASLQAVWNREGPIAALADDLFVPTRIRDWIRARRA